MKKFCFMMLRLCKKGNIYREGTTEGSWHYVEYEEVACKEFCMLDGCQRDEGHSRCCSDCFQGIMAKRERALHVRD